MNQLGRELEKVRAATNSMKLSHTQAQIRHAQAHV